MFQTAKKILWLSLPLFCSISLIITLACYDNLPRGYELMPLLPVLYLSVFLLFYRFIFSSDYKITATVYFSFQFLRLVIAPAVTALGGTSEGGRLSIVSTDNLQLAILLTIVEFIILSAFIAIVGQKKIKKVNTQPLYLAGSSIAYALFACLAIIVFFFYKNQGVNLVYFIALPASQDGRLGDLTDTILVIAKQIVTLSISFMFLTIVSSNQRKNLLRPRNKYSNRSIIAAILVVCVIVGERRSVQVYSALITCYILIRAFPKKKFKIVTLVCCVAASVFLVMSIYKMFAAFYYGSYSEALSQADWGISNLSVLLDSYFAGPKNIGIALEFADYNNLQTSQLFFDFARSTVPISFLLKGNGVVTSVLLNTFIYAGAQNTGHVLAATGYGYIFGGIVFSWVPALVNIAVCLFAEKQVRTAKSFEAVHIWLTVLFRFALNSTANTPALMSAATNHLFTASVAFGSAILIKKVVNIHADNNRLLRYR